VGAIRPNHLSTLLPTSPLPITLTFDVSYLLPSRLPAYYLSTCLPMPTLIHPFTLSPHHPSAASEASTPAPLPACTFLHTISLHLIHPKPSNYQQKYSRLYHLSHHPTPIFNVADAVQFFSIYRLNLKSVSISVQSVFAPALAGKC
jgi:hypothetical protein